MTVRRLSVSALALLSSVLGSQAADYGGAPILRGSNVFAPSPAPYAAWSGFYVGGQGGYTHAEASFGTGARSMLDNLFDMAQSGNPRMAVPMSQYLEDAAGGWSYGGFIGYNTQFENVVVGVEANYNRTSLNLTSTETVPLILPDIGTASMSSTGHITDYGTLRLRAGYVLGSFMPYAMVGIAAGRGDFTDSARLQYIPVENGVAQAPVDLSGNAQQNGKIAYGWAAGAGIDIMLTGSIFVRGEYEFVQFTSSGTAPVVVGSSEPLDHLLNLNTFRGAVGFKF
jgi:outer membrane immunogenic protein